MDLHTLRSLCLGGIFNKPRAQASVSSSEADVAKATSGGEARRANEKIAAAAADVVQVVVVSAVVVATRICEVTSEREILSEEKINQPLFSRRRKSAHRGERNQCKRQEKRAIRSFVLVALATFCCQPV